MNSRENRTVNLNIEIEKVHFGWEGKINCYDSHETECVNCDYKDMGHPCPYPQCPLRLSGRFKPEEFYNECLEDIAFMPVIGKRDYKIKRFGPMGMKRRRDNVKE